MHALHAVAGADHAVPVGGELRLVGIGLLKGGGLVCAAQHDAQVANRRRPPAIAECSLSNQLIRCGAQAVVGQHQQRDIGGNEAPSAIDTLTKGIVVGIQIEDNDLTVLFRNQAIDSGLAGVNEELEFLAQGR